MSSAIGNNSSSFPQSYLDDIKNQAFKRMDEGGNGDGKVTVDEALNDLNIGSLLKGQNIEDARKIMSAASDIPDVLAKYAGDDGEFSAEEWASFLNGDEWGNVLDSWHSSGRKAELEMAWTDNAHIQDDKVTKGEVKVGILNNLLYNESQYGMEAPPDTTDIEELIDKYAGDDGTFTFKEYHQMKNDPVYKEFIETYNVVPWFNIDELSNDG